MSQQQSGQQNQQANKNGSYVGGDNTTIGDTGDISGAGIAIGTGASVQIYGNIQYYPIKLRTERRKIFEPLLDNRTKLFAGRDAAFAKIGEFISKSEGGYLVITAPAGFGKTALMANLVTNNPEAFAYHFFSPYTNASSVTEVGFLENVVEQMAQWHGHTEELPSKLPDLQALYHKFIDDKLERTQILVLDGLDEVSIWKLHPYLSRDLPDNLHVIVTIRDVEQDWANDYQLPKNQIQHLPLGGLTRDGVAEVLHQAGKKATEFADKPELLDQVMRVSAYPDNEALGADPFYVRLLAEDAADGELTAAKIGQQPNGLDNYLDVWWKNLKEITKKYPTKEEAAPVKDLLGTLTVTLGPIAREDMEKINPSLEDDWEDDFFDEVINEVRRFVLGDREQGYALVHPRLRQYMRRKIKIADYTEKLLNFCANWEEHHSPYALRYYAEHLIEAGCPEELHKLLAKETDNKRNAWYEAKEKIGDTADFITDVSLAWEEAEKEFNQNSGVAIGRQCRYALMTTSINSMATNIPAELLVALVEKKVWTAQTGLTYALQNSDQLHKAVSLIKLADFLPSNQKQQALNEALTAARLIQDEKYRARVLSNLAPLLPEENLLKEALTAAPSIQSKSVRARFLRDLAPKLENLLKEALTAAPSIQSESDRARVLRDLAPKLPENLLKEALTAAPSIQSESARAVVLSDLAPLLPENLLNEALTAARSIQDEKYRAVVLSDLAPLLPENLLKEALTAAGSIQNEEYRAGVPSDIAALLPENLLKEALTAGRSIQDKYYRAHALSKLAEKLSQMEQNQLFPYWRDTLHILSVGTRKNLLSDIKVLIPIISSLGDKKGLKHTADAILDVSRWWR